MQQTFGQGDVDAARNARLQSSHLSASSTTDAGATILPQQPQLKSAEQQDHLPPTPRWNTADLPLRVAGDMLAASAAAGLVAPIVTAIDKSASSSHKRTRAQADLDNEGASLRMPQISAPLHSHYAPAPSSSSHDRKQCSLADPSASSSCCTLRPT